LKKKILVSMLIAVVLLLTIGSAVMADDPTEVNVTWDGTGVVAGTVDLGDDAVHSFQSVGVINTGSFYSKDSNDNPYNYNVDSTIGWLDTTISTGYAWFSSQRTDAKTSYGNAGQESYTYVSTVDGLATLQNRSSSNYASMKDCNYGWNANNHITISGSSDYFLQRYMDSGDNNFVGLMAFGSGDADLDCMSSEASQGQVKLGAGCGCYTNAKFNANGTGTLDFLANADTGIASALVPGVSGMISFGFIANWIGSFSITDYSTIAD